jgi:hypothetical protein
VAAVKPSIVFPYAAADRALFPRLQAIAADLKAHYARAYVCRPPGTPRHADVTDWLAAERFFTLIGVDHELPAGERFTRLYLHAARLADPDEMLHLAYLDRLSFALQSGHRAAFLADVGALSLADLPLLYQRSPAAWATHPSNYARLEGFVTLVGERLFGRALDYTWCHLVVRADELRQVMARVTHTGLSMVGQMILQMQHHLRVRDVDWLSWEDPLILDRDPAELKAEREASVREYEKRLSYCLPVVEAMVQFAATSGLTSSADSARPSSAGGPSAPA